MKPYIKPTIAVITLKAEPLMGIQSGTGDEYNDSDESYSRDTDEDFLFGSQTFVPLPIE